MMRLIRPEEIKPVARLMAECFSDYPLYDVFFPGEKNRLERVYYFFLMRIWCRQKFTYVTDDLSVAMSIQKPGEQATSPWGLLLGTRFLLDALRVVPIRALLLAMEYTRAEGKLEKKYYNPAEDWYVHAICILKQARGGGTLLQVFRQIDEGAPVFCTTHTVQNVKLYRFLGAKVCEQMPWRGTTCYFMRRERKEKKDVEAK